ncbi:sulfurtransferase complex subunit TusB [Microbulbifer guangxiensis]|uniref:sulfurtransferase complex subunit TusB n=1 Tax=Microbulbifer guangxiensis TaxID=2904249 RepID=UPI001F0326D5|nr:sulfurtransferase complex subunit TusB [Microbulbifer guangxiensis]
MTLHIVNQSPYRTSALRDCLDAMADGDALLLIEDGVYAAGAPTGIAPIPAGTYCLQADAVARGITPAKSITLIDDERWIALCVEHTPIVSWF